MARPIMRRMTRPLVSYAQNFEDVMLWRALRDVEHGFYIDVGAYDPDEDSVTRAFYDRGWHGINVEPHPEYHRRLLAGRPRDLNLRVALGERTGEVTMHFVGDTGLSTADTTEATKRAREGYGVVDGVVTQETLAAICEQYVPLEQTVHFLKVDVEGSERAVLLGADWVAWRPWIVVVEATRPMSQVPSHQEWEGILTSAGYGFVYGDGLNRFYVATERDELRQAFAFPPNYFDDFVPVSEVVSSARANRAEAQLAAILTSRTWRYTRPLRATARLARRTRAKGRRLLADARRAIKGRSMALARNLFTSARGDKRLRRRAAVLKKVPGVPALYRRLGDGSTRRGDGPKGAGASTAIDGTADDADLPGTGRATAITHPETTERRVIVDVSSLIRHDYGGGIQRVVRSMLTWLPTVLPVGYRMEPAYATADGGEYRRASWVLAERAAGRLIASSDVLEPRPGDVFLGLDLNYQAVSAHAGFHSQLRRLGIPVYFVVYDLLPVLLPHRFPPAVPDAHARWLMDVAAADGALCISRAVADDLRSWIDANGPDRGRPLRIDSFHLGADISDTDHADGRPDDAAETLRRLDARPTFLLVGTLEPRKGHVQTLDAFELLWDEKADVNLALVGKVGWKMEAFVARLQRHPEIGKRLFWMAGIGDDYLDEIYRAAACVIAPSEGEGFGLPLIEAAQHGTPLLVRDIPVFREVAGDHASYFDGSDASNLADAVREWLTLWRDGSHPRSDAMPWLTWEESARQLVAALFYERSQVPLDVSSVA
jgi:FkbM family methyltransferase